MGKLGLSATEIGSKIGARNTEVNRLLKDQGFLYGKPGEYGLTSKGEEYGVQRHHDDGWGGVAYRDWEETHYDPSILDVLDSSPERLAKVRADISADRLTQRAEKEAAQDEYEANYQASKAAREKADAQEEHDEAVQGLIVFGVVALVAIVIVAKKGVDGYKRRKAEKAKRNRKAEAGSDPSNEAEEE